MDIDSQCEDGVLSLIVAGLVDGSNAYELIDTVEERLTDAHRRNVDLQRIVLDVVGATFADFAVTGLLLRLCEQAASIGAQVTLRGASPELSAAVAAGGLTSDITLEASPA